MRKNLCTLAAVLAFALVLSSCSSSIQPMATPSSTNTSLPMAKIPLLPTPTPDSGSLPAVQRITVENADKVQLLRTMDIPGYRKGQTSQCSLAFSPDGSSLVGACGKNQVPVWEVQDGHVRHLLYDQTQQVVACEFHPAGKIIACGGFDKKITFWNPETGEKISDFGSHDSPVWDLDFSPDGQQLASCSLADDIRLWDVKRDELLWSYAGSKAYLSVAFDPSGKTIAYGSRWGNAGVLDVVTGEGRIELIKLYNPIGDVAFSSSGKILAAGTDDNTIHLWNTDDYQPVTTLEGHWGYVNGVSFSPDETLLVSGSHDKTIGIWNVASHKLVKMLDGHKDAVLRVVFNQDGTLIASISWDGTVRLWGIPVR